MDKTEELAEIIAMVAIELLGDPAVTALKVVGGDKELILRGGN